MYIKRHSEKTVKTLTGLSIRERSSIARYSKSKNKNLHNLMTYAKQMNVEERVRNHIEVLI